ncbi:MAG TPA: BCD family MFS transporter [Sphingomonas sp.]|nr:BCD family MFS transporter [Sphingomonas sp.]
MQSAIGAIVMLATSLLNRVMVVEYALPATLPAGLVAWHYAVQLSRPAWGHKSDGGGRRTPWIVAGMTTLALGALLAVGSIGPLAERSPLGYALAFCAFTLIGIGVAAAGTSLLALLAARVAPERRAAAASITWVMMIAGIVVSAGVAGALTDPFSLPRLTMVVAAVAGVALLIAMVAVRGVEGSAAPGSAVPDLQATPSPALKQVLGEMWADGTARRFTFFVFLSMLAYSMQDLILEPFAGLVFAYTPGQSTHLSGLQHAGVLAGMILVGVGGNAFGGRGQGRGEGGHRWIVGGCIGSAIALAGLALGAQTGAGWPLAANIILLGFANGVFAVAAIGSMMTLASRRTGHEGARIGVWGAAQAIAFGLGGLIGAVGVDIGRALTGSTTGTFTMVFLAEAMLFLAAASLAVRTPARRSAVWSGVGEPA